MSANLLGNRDGRAVFAAWRTEARTRLEKLPRSVGQLIRLLAPPSGDFPDLLTPLAAQKGIEAGIDAVLSTRRRQLARELTALSRIPSWAGPLIRGELEALTVLGQALKDYFAHVMGPCWPRVQAQIEADRVRRARAFMAGGADGLLDSLRPTLRWQSPVLEADYPTDRDIHLDGRGLLLIPSVFCWRTPVTWIDPALPPVVVYPVDRTPTWWTPEPTTRRTDPLASLLGATRADLLRAATDGGASGELARRTGNSPAITSYHLKVLREAGLVIALPDGPQILYAATPLGRGLAAMP
ncbi:ArsR/SmtB family transcription factor [Streptomyces smaragdinus]|nr:ArsR family transcriptional regulator [Streptomyces smaragdinus]